MEANKIFSKLNMKNYNNELEKILETKVFSSDVKNLLLSMLYKIENAYKDYKTVKVDVLDEKDFINYLLKIIKERCFEIELINPEENIPVQVDKEKGYILCYPNEKSLLSAIWYMGEDDVFVLGQFEYTKNAIQKMLYIGSNINQTEVLRDFNGWSWDTVIKEIEDVKYNIIYQSMLLLDGKKLINANMDIEEKETILISKKDKEYNDFIEKIYRLSIDINIAQDKAEFDKISKIRKEKIKQLELFNNKKEFVQKMTESKKECLSEIEKIDKIINNTELLKKEYKERNDKLPNKEKIFSISHLADRLEKERKELLSKIQNCNKMIEPKGFVKEKEKVKTEVDFLNRINFGENQNNEDIVQYCKEFLKCARKQIEKLEEKVDIVNWIYKIRYYLNLPFDENTCLKDIKMLNKDFKDTIKLITKKAQLYKIWDIFSEDEELTYIIINGLFGTKMINLENANILCKYEKGILYVEYYDTNLLERNAQFERENIRIKKKIKLFI